jgi:rhodanese-related sulfurtransferase
MGGHYRYNTGMPVKRVPPREAEKLLADGYKYVDVRSVPEFESGHPKGAFNVPLMHFLPGRGMSPNPDFAAVVEKKFDKGEKLVLGCKTGGRSLRAAELLAGMGYTNVVDMQGGFDGERDAAGRLSVPGWKESGLAIETDAPGRTWADLSGT